MREGRKGGGRKNEGARMRKGRRGEEGRMREGKGGRGGKGRTGNQWDWRGTASRFLFLQKIV